MLAVTAMLAACQTAPPPAGSARSCSVGIVGDSLTVGSQPYWNNFADRYPQLRLWDRIHLTDGGYNLRAHMIANFVSGR